MNSDKIIKYINWLILFTALAAIAVLVFGKGFFKASDFNIIPAVLITIYTALNGIKFVLTGKQKTGYALIYFSVIIVFIIAILKMKLF